MCDKADAKQRDLEPTLSEKERNLELYHHHRDGVIQNSTLIVAAVFGVFVILNILAGTSLGKPLSWVVFSAIYAAIVLVLIFGPVTRFIQSTYLMQRDMKRLRLIVRSTDLESYELQQLHSLPMLKMKFIESQDSIRGWLLGAYLGVAGLAVGAWFGVYFAAP